MKSSMTIWNSSQQKTNHPKTKPSRPKQIIRFKNKLHMAKTKVLISGFWSVVIQVSGAMLHDMSTISIFKFLFCLPVTICYEIKQVSDRPAQSLL